MKHERLIVPQNYVTAIEQTLGIELSPNAIKTKVGKQALEKYARSVEKLSAGLTKDRKSLLASSYLNDNDLRKAYLLYYTTTNLLKIIPPLREFFLTKDIEEKKKLRILDLGCGMGAASLGALHYLRDELKYQGDIELVMSDNVNENLWLAATVLRSFDNSQMSSTTFIQHDLRNWTNRTNVTDGVTDHAPYDLIFAMNVLNELSEESDSVFLENALSLLEKDGALMMIEPATRNESRRLLRFRDLSVGSGATIYSPCTRQADCPALINPNDWCHTEIAWERPKFIEAIDELVGNVRLSLKSTYLVITKNGDTLPSRLGKEKLSRVVSELFIEKGRRRVFLCNTDGRHEFVMNIRDKSASNSDVLELERYDLIDLSGEEVREHDRRITEASGVTLMLRSSGAR